jgi:hypothetical protein
VSRRESKVEAGGEKSSQIGNWSKQHAHGLASVNDRLTYGRPFVSRVPSRNFESTVEKNS